MKTNLKKRTLILFAGLLLSLLSTTSLKAQIEFQGHFDWGDKRYYPTLTFQLFKPDTLGSTFFFVDADIVRKDGASLMYFELNRAFTIHKKSGLNVQIEYNDGLLISNRKVNDTIGKGYPIHGAVLAGFGYPIKMGKFFLIANIYAKYFIGMNHPDVQFTLMWNHTFWDGRMTTSGFVDLWSERKDIYGGTSKTGKLMPVFLTEPQLWYNITPHIALGLEVEMSYNFLLGAGVKGFFVAPTVGFKWTL